MAEPIPQSRIINSQTEQIRALVAERDHLNQELNQYRIDTATAAIRGLEVLVALAAAGNPAARLAVQTLLDTLKQAQATLSGLIVVKS